MTPRTDGGSRSGDMSTRTAVVGEHYNPEDRKPPNERAAATMTQDEYLAAVWEAAEEVSDTALVLTVMFALRDADVAEEIRAVLNGPERSRAALIRAMGRHVSPPPANDP